VLEALRQVPADGKTDEATLCHGDMHVRHVLFDEDGLLSGVIDWGDLCIGDPAMDLIAVYAMLGPPHREAFWQEYGVVSEGLRVRARHLALAKHLALLSSAVELGQLELVRVAREALERVLTPVGGDAGSQIS
jgi:aminoglycoside phosphotransferase (APT) family kinase protein